MTRHSRPVVRLPPTGAPVPLALGHSHDFASAEKLIPLHTYSGTRSYPAPMVGASSSGASSRASRSVTLRLSSNFSFVRSWQLTPGTCSAHPIHQPSDSPKIAVNSRVLMILLRAMQGADAVSPKARGIRHEKVRFWDSSRLPTEVTVAPSAYDYVASNHNLLSLDDEVSIGTP